MKRNYFRSLSLALVGMLIFSCSSDDDAGNHEIAPVNSLFNVQGAVLLEEGFPSANSDASLEVVSMNTHVITGGTSYATIRTSTPAQKLFVGAVDRSGYYELAAENTTDLSQNFILKINQLNRENHFVVSLAYLDENNQISQPRFVDLRVLNVGTGALQVNLSFDNDKDVDLHLIEPNGSHIYYGNEESSNGGMLDLDSNPMCIIDSINNENITYSDDAVIEPGIYSVYVDMYQNCNDAIATNFVVSVILHGVEIQTSAQNPFEGSFPIGFPSNRGGLGIADDMAPVLTFEITEEMARNAQSQRRSFVPRQLSPSAITKLEKSNNR